MKLTTRTRSAAVAITMAGGASILLFGTMPAYAATETCGPTGSLVSPGVCEQIFTSGTATFTPTAQMTTLEALLVGAGGSGIDQSVQNSNGYASGGGGEVKIVDLTGAEDPIEVTVSTHGTQGGLAYGATTQDVGNGLDASTDEAGGASGNGNPGVSRSGAGAGGSPAGGTGDDGASGGAGLFVGDIAPTGSLFVGDTRCFGGGGAIGDDASTPPTVGTPGCGGGGPDGTGAVLFSAEANSGGGGGAVRAAQSAELRAGASGVVILRWNSFETTDPDDVTPAPSNDPTRPTSIQTAREG